VEIITRAEAIQRGLKRYFTGKPCKHGHIAERLLTRTCVECGRGVTRRWQAANPDQCRKQGHKWRGENPDRWAAHRGLHEARKRFPDCVPSDFDFDATIPFYTERRRLTKETGVKHDVDHILALRLGGKHLASNLQVNRHKGKAARAEARRVARQKKNPPSCSSAGFLCGSNFAVYELLAALHRRCVLSATAFVCSAFTPRPYLSNVNA
jgi:hypothetical protein